MSRIGDLIAVGLLGEPNGLGLTANEAHVIGDRIALQLPIALDAAWAEVEAALAEDRPGIRNGFVEMLNRTAREDAERWCASAMTDQGGWIAFGPTPAAALRALAAKLREHWRDD